MLPEKYPYSEFFCFVFSRIRTEYRKMLPISPYSFRMWGNTDQKNFEYGYFLRSANFTLEIMFPSSVNLIQINCRFLCPLKTLFRWFNIG